MGRTCRCGGRIVKTAETQQVATYRCDSCTRIFTQAKRLPRRPR